MEWLPYGALFPRREARRLGRPVAPLAGRLPSYEVLGNYEELPRITRNLLGFYKES